MSETFKLVDLTNSTNLDSGQLDWGVEANGRISLLADQDVLDQDFRKIVLSTRGAHPFNPAYGSIFRGLIGGKVLSETLVSVIGSELSRLVSFLRAQQVSLLGRVPFTPNELISDLRSAIVAQDTVDRIVVITRIGTVQGEIEAEVAGET